MIQIKQFQAERMDEVPKWKDAIKWLDEEKIEARQVIGVTVYPTSRFHNLVIIYNDNLDGKTDPVKPE